MNKIDTIRHLKSIKRKYLWRRGLEVALYAAAIGLLIFFMLDVFSPSTITTTIAACCTAAFTAAIRIFQLKLFAITENNIIEYLNHQHPLLQESTDLLIIPDEELNTLQRIQKQRTFIQFQEIYSSIKLPHNIGRASGAFVASVLICIGLTSFSTKISERNGEKQNSISHETVVQENLPAFILESTITILPPKYTQLERTTSDNFSIRAPEGSTIRWDIRFEGTVEKALIILSGKDSLPLTSSGETFTTEKIFSTSDFYQLQWTTLEGKNQSSDFYKIEVIQDQSPTIAIEGLSQFTELKASDKIKINVKSILTDDYGLKQASIIATVSKGSGEAIKFREEQLKFDAPATISGKEIQATRMLDLHKLGLEPGDELYFYVQASDIKIPVANIARTETYFITISDTTTLTASLDAGLGVDVLPEYFRSQRQIIIDSEKLLKEKRQISKENFNERSNMLAHDQKLLRLRYGEFLGEEFESSIGPQESHSEELSDEGVEKKFGHAHDTENEHNHVEEKSQDQNQSGAKKDLPKEYVHAHDSEEEATFFTQSIRTKLKAAITIMWDAELYLRLYQPEKSLSYQYKALVLLKEISQDSRIYVHRTGFDPPPLKEEKRLSGDLSEIKNNTFTRPEKNHDSYPHIRVALQEIEKLLIEDKIVITPSRKTLFKNSGEELAQVALKQPGDYLKTLSQVKRLTQNEIDPAELKSVLIDIRAAYWKVLPNNINAPQKRLGTVHALDTAFLKNMQTSNQNY